MLRICYETSKVAEFLQILARQQKSSSVVVNGMIT